MLAPESEAGLDAVLDPSTVPDTFQRTFAEAGIVAELGDVEVIECDLWGISLL